MPENTSMKREKFNFQEIDFQSLSTFPYTIKDLQDRKIDGLIIKGFISKQEVEKVKKIVGDNKKNFHPIRTGYTYPIAYFEADQASSPEYPIENHFRNWAKYRAGMADFFSIDVEDRFKKVLKTLQPDIEPDILQGKSGEGSYIPYTVRVFEPGLGGIPIHCGNMFEGLLPTLYSDLKSKVQTFNQLSFFTTIQNPDSGGELTLYNLFWKVGQKSINDDDVSLPDNSFFKGKENVNFKLTLDEGDLLIFAAGEIWHRVETPIGKSRITMGGFLGFTHDKKHLAFWS
jgi:hypothetical protein